MHAVFLYHAIQAGMDMGIVNAGQLAVYESIDPELREACEDVILNRPRLHRAPARSRRALQGWRRPRIRGKDLTWRTRPVEERISHALVNGITEFIDADTEEARRNSPARLRLSRGR